ncbi:uncharacterized protein LOC107016423 [Solanum pennellii]|uniref:Uncharacterized protein LOC107016423 n=1 Tax=Solanum pennellii TaxID=28526 RepID=A0ABM1GKN5_SOLPN|nr:uncharacterized protein LOC107016423 [Solanum pennellii]
MKRKALGLADSKIRPVSGNKEPPVSSASVIGASEQELNCSISSIHPRLRYKSANVLRHSLGSTLRDSNSVSPNSSLLKNRALDRNMISPTHRTVESEPVVETSVQANAGTAVRPAGTFEANVDLQSIELSTTGLLEIKPMKCEPIQDVSGGDLSTLSDIAAKECYGYDYEFADHYSFAGSVREDDVYEDGEIREPMMQSIAEDLIANVQEGCEKDVLRIGPSARSRGAVKNANETNNEYIGRSDMSSIALSSFQNAETPVYLRYRYMEEEELHIRRNRDEIYGYGPKFVRDRFQDRSFGSSRGDFIHGRGRGWGRGRYFVPDFERFGGVADYPFRHKRTAFESANGYDVDAFGTNKRRKPLNDDLPSLRHPPARRQSPNRREDAAMMGTQRLRRAPRNISPRKCTDKDGFAYVGIRHGEKFNRDFPADRHKQSKYSHLAQGDTEFTAMQRSGLPRMRSKSPIRSHTWSLPPRRLTEELNGRQDLSQHRSLVMYREDRTRPSSRTSFTEEAIAPQRRDPPSYSAHRQSDRWDVDGVQEYGHPRSHYNRGRGPDRERADGVRQMKNVKEQEGGGNRRRRHEEEFDGSRLNKRIF